MKVETIASGKPAAVDGGVSAFPTARYFQVHFEYLESLLNEARMNLEALRQDVATVHRQQAQPQPETLGKARRKPAAKAANQRSVAVGAPPALHLIQQ